MQNVTAQISGEVKDGGEKFSESFAYTSPTTLEEAEALVGGDVVKFVAEVTNATRERGVKNGMVNAKKGSNLADRFAALCKTYGAGWVWSPRGAGLKTLVQNLSAAQASGDKDALAAAVAALTAKYAADDSAE